MDTHCGFAFHQGAWFNGAHTRRIKSSPPTVQKILHSLIYISACLIICLLGRWADGPSKHYICAMIHHSRGFFYKIEPRRVASHGNLRQWGFESRAKCEGLAFFLSFWYLCFVWSLCCYTRMQYLFSAERSVGLLILSYSTNLYTVNAHLAWDSFLPSRFLAQTLFFCPTEVQIFGSRKLESTVSHLACWQAYQLVLHPQCSLFLLCVYEHSVCEKLGDSIWKIQLT